MYMYIDRALESSYPSNSIVRVLYPIATDTDFLCMCVDRSRLDTPGVNRLTLLYICHCVSERERERVCVCVCMCVHVCVCECVCKCVLY